MTGGAAGLGRHLAWTLSGAGCQVVVADRDGAAAEACAGEIRRGGGTATAVGCDVTVDADLVGLVGIADELGGADLLVNNAGGWGGAPEQYPDAAVGEWTAVLDLNLWGPMRATQLVLAGMRRRGRGAVVNIASSAGVEDTAYRSPPYAAAKAGLLRLTTSLAGLATQGVSVTCVVPGWIGLERAHRQWAALPARERASLPDLVRPELVADTVVGLVRDDVAGGTVVELLDGDQVRVVPPGG